MSEHAANVAHRAERWPGAVPVSRFPYLLGMAYLLGAIGNLAIAAMHTGDWAGLLDPSLGRYGDPKDHLTPIGPNSLWNPLTWLFGLAHTAALFVVPLAVVAVVAGAAYAFDPALRTDRPALRRLLVGTAIGVALLAVSLSPYGRQLQHWLLD
ncbi:hypothetical protein [Plantactinospora sp. GCM10030261]|uniref:hypothetical protein n=1 Tax=Plantactinospora sp. GCM10030261 TaxID=3273420 RepID=UPI0036187AA9